METTEKLLWIIVVVALVAAASTVIVKPILDKAGEAKDDIDGIEFTTEVSTTNCNLKELTEAVLNDNLRRT